MIKSFLNIYKTQLLISFTVGIATIALGVIKNPIEIAFIIFASILGTFVLDFDYLIHAYFVEPDEKFSKDLRSYIKHKDYKGALKYIKLNQDAVQEKTLNSALFQIIFCLFGIFVIYSNVFFTIKTLVLVIMANSIYRVIEMFFTKNLDAWFWSFKSTPNKNNFYIYVGVLFLIFVYCLRIL